MSIPATKTFIPGAVDIHVGDNLEIIQRFPDAAFTLIYLDPPFNTGRTRQKAVESVFRIQEEEEGDDADAAESRGDGEERPATSLISERHRRGTGFRGQDYARLRGDLLRFDDKFDDYWTFLEPRLVEAWRLLADDGTLYLHMDYREAHYAKVLMDALFGRENFLNEIIWAYDYGGKSRSKWPNKHETILVYVKNPRRYIFDSDAVDREPYMAPGLVTAEKAARGKLPTDVWWHTIVPTSGSEKTGYPTQKPEGILRRIVQASSREGDLVLDFFAGSGTTGAVASALGRHAILVEANLTAITVMQKRMPHAHVHL